LLSWLAAFLLLVAAVTVATALGFWL